MRFKDQVVVVTGAARGIGFQSAIQFAQEGARVVITDLDPAAVDAAVARIQAQGGASSGISGDASDPAQVSKHVEQLLREFGQIDVLVNNAGAYALVPTVDVQPQDWRKIMAVNIDAAFFWSQAVAARSMIPRRCGAIVNVASGAGLAGLPNAAAYVTSKHAIVGMTKALSVDWGQYNIRVNAVAPGLTWTEMAKSGQARDPVMFAERERRIPLGHVAAVEDQANAILFLASNQAASIHGHILVSDGGTMAMSSGYTVQRDADS